MDPNNIGIVRFARAGANFPPKSSNTSSRNLGVAVGRIAVDYRSTLYSDKVPPTTWTFHWELCTIQL